MIINLKNITQVPRRFTFVMEPDWWQGDGVDERIVGLAAPAQARLTLFRAGERYVLEGRLDGKLRFRCDRCLELFDRDLASDFRLCLLPSPSGEEPEDLELSGSDLSDDFITGDELDLDEVVREQIYFLVPLKCLCADDCKGLCPVCGANLNTGMCRCRKVTGHPGFRALEGLRIG